MDERRVMLNLDDFGKLRDINILKSKKKQEEITVQEVEKFYQEKILELEESYKELIKEIEKESYKKGFEEASKKKDEEYYKVIDELKKSMLEEKKEEISRINEKYKDIEKELSIKIESYLDNLNNILLDSLDEILEFLYIQKSNKNIIENGVFSIISEFKDSLPLEIKVSPEIYDEIKNSFNSINIKKDESLKRGDFVIEFNNFKLENSIKSKIEVLKNEIKREIKKLT